jgi:GNAT superfamily N-acetyltransferase
LYIATLGVLAPYRRQGLATRLLKHILEQARASWTAAAVPPTVPAPPSKDDKKKGTATKSLPAPTPSSPRIVGLKVHVQTSNPDARTFWERQGFAVTQTLERCVGHSSVKARLLMTWHAVTTNASSRRAHGC